MTRNVSTSQPASLSESLGFRETVVEVGMIHPGVRRVLSQYKFIQIERCYHFFY